MPLMKSTGEQHLRLLISGSFTIFQAADYKAQLLAVLGHTADLLEVDLSGIEEVDSAGLQLLLMLSREARAHDKDVVFTGVSPAMENMIDLLQLHGRFHLTDLSGGAT